MNESLQIGQIAPDFSALDSSGVEISLKDFLGKTIILYFYPKDNTPGCTTEAKDFSDLFKEFLQKDCVIVGISPDSTTSHKNFIAKHNLKIILLSDSDKKIANLYGAYGKKMMYGKEVMGIIRSTFVIDKALKITQIHRNVKVKNHAKTILDSIL